MFLKVFCSKIGFAMLNSRKTIKSEVFGYLLENFLVSVALTGCSFAVKSVRKDQKIP